MTLKFTLSQFTAPRAVVRALAVCVSLALAVALGCGGGSQTPILASAQSAVIMDVSALLESSEIPIGVGGYLYRWADFPNVPLVQAGTLNNPAEWKEELRNYFEDDDFTPTDSISMSAYVSGPTYNYRYIAGGLDFAAYRNEIYDDGAKKDGDIWGGGSTAHAILEDREIVVLGDEEAVKDVANAFDSGEGFVDESSLLKRALDKAGGGLLVRASDNCGNALMFRNLSGCDAFAESVKGGDARSTEIVGVYLFSDERLAESNRNDLEERINEAIDNDTLNADFEEIKADGAFVTYRATFYR